MKCNKVKKQLDYYLDNLLSEKERREWEGHLQGCPACRETHRSALKLRGLLSGKKEDRVPSGYWVSFWPRLRAKLPEHRPRSFIFPVWKPAYAAVAGSVLIILLAVYTGTVIRDRGGISRLTTPLRAFPHYVVARVVPASGEDKPAPNYVIGTRGEAEGKNRDENFVLASAALSSSPGAVYW